MVTKLFDELECPSLITMLVREAGMEVDGDEQ
jgi:hypothetical protein